MLFYISAPIDLTKEESPWKKLANMVETMGHSAFVPMTAYAAALQSPVKVFEMCLRAVEVSDIMLAWYPPDVHTVGVPMELYHAAIHKKPVCILGRNRDDITESCALSWLADRTEVIPLGRNFDVDNVLGNIIFIKLVRSVDG
jgi:hypothetical protein